MRSHPLKFVKPILLLLLSIFLPVANAEEKPIVLLIARDDAPPFGETSLKIAIDKEVNTFIGRLGALGYAVDVASENGKDISAGGSTLTVDKKHAEAKITH